MHHLLLDDSCYSRADWRWYLVMPPLRAPSHVQALRAALEDGIRLAAENPARAFGHYPRKGALLPGSEADIVIFDPSGETALPGDGFGDGTGDSVYAGW